MNAAEIKFHKEYRVDLFGTTKDNIYRIIQTIIFVYILHRILDVVVSFDSPELVLVAIFGYIYLLLKSLHYVFRDFNLAYKPIVKK